MAESTATRKKAKILSEETKKRKRESDKLKARTRINVGRAFARWRALKEDEGFPTDADLAVMLLDCYERKGPATSTPYKGPVTSTPYKGEVTAKPPGPPVSSVTDSSDHERGRQMDLSGVEELMTESEKVDVLESSMHSLAISEQNNDELEAANDLQNSMIEMEEAVCWEDDESDEDYVPFLYLRSTGTSRAEIDKLPEIHIDESVLDIEEVDIVPVEDQRVPIAQKVETVEDLVGKKTSICYNDNLLLLARYMQLPVQSCQFKDPILGTLCNGRPPFNVQLTSRGTGVILEWVCHHGHRIWHWNSQPLLKFGMQGGDFMLSTNILLSGNNYRKILLLFKFMCMGMVAETTFFAIQSEYCIKPVEEFWKESREKVLNRLRQKTEVVVLGDGRMDSPGHCAQFCTYTMIELESRDIVHIVSEDKRKCGRNSVILEKVCFENTMDCLLNEIPIKEVVTDAHIQISALLDPVRGKYKDWSLTHSLDVWHASKNLGRKLREAAKGKEHAVLMHWVKDIVNHFWYCCQRATTVEQFKMLWNGVLHHVRNEHTWATGFCEHEPLDDSSHDKPWIQQGSAAHQTLTAIVLNKRWLKDVKKYITFRTTSDLESFQNHILMYAGKRFAYKYKVYKTRVFLAAIDYNYHNGREHRRNKKGEKIYRRYYNKKSKNWSVHVTKEAKTYAYIPDLQKAILRRRLESGSGLPRTRTLSEDDPEHLGLVGTADTPPPTAELVARHISRGALALVMED